VLLICASTFRFSSIAADSCVQKQTTSLKNKLLSHCILFVIHISHVYLDILTDSVSSLVSVVKHCVFKTLTLIEYTSVSMAAMSDSFF